MKPDTRSFSVQAVQRVIDHAVAHLDEAVALDRLAAEACLSPFHFHRVYDPRGVIPQVIRRDFGGRSMNVEIKNFPELRVAAVRHIGPCL